MDRNLLPVGRGDLRKGRVRSIDTVAGRNPITQNDHLTRRLARLITDLQCCNCSRRQAGPTVRNQSVDPCDRRSLVGGGGPLRLWRPGHSIGTERHQTELGLRAEGIDRSGDLLLEVFHGSSPVHRTGLVETPEEGISLVTIAIKEDRFRRILFLIGGASASGRQIEGTWSPFRLLQ